MSKDNQSGTEPAAAAAPEPQENEKQEEKPAQQAREQPKKKKKNKKPMPPGGKPIWGPSPEPEPKDENAPPDRSACLEMAAKADVVKWCEKHGVPLREEGDYYRHSQIEPLVMKGRWWARADFKKAGALRRYDCGGLIQYLMEYGGVSMEEALQAALDQVKPGTVLPKRKPRFERKRKDGEPRKRLRLYIDNAKGEKNAGPNHPRLAKDGAAGSSSGKKTTAASSRRKPKGGK